MFYMVNQFPGKFGTSWILQINPASNFLTAGNSNVNYDTSTLGILCGRVNLNELHNPRRKSWSQQASEQKQAQKSKPPMTINSFKTTTENVCIAMPRKESVKMWNGNSGSSLRDLIFLCYFLKFLWMWINCVNKNENRQLCHQKSRETVPDSSTGQGIRSRNERNRANPLFPWLTNALLQNKETASHIQHSQGCLLSSGPGLWALAQQSQRAGPGWPPSPRQRSWARTAAGPVLDVAAEIMRVGNKVHTQKLGPLVVRNLPTTSVWSLFCSYKSHIYTQKDTGAFRCIWMDTDLLVLLFLKNVCHHPLDNFINAQSWQRGLAFVSHFSNKTSKLGAKGRSGEKWEQNVKAFYCWEVLCAKKHYVPISTQQPRETNIQTKGTGRQ